MQLRHEAAVELAGRVEPRERWALLWAVVAPSAELAEASRERANAPDAKTLRRQRQRCRSCGISFATGHTPGCETCADRACSARRRVEARAQAGRAEAVTR